MAEKKSLSIIVPLYNEEEALPYFAPRLFATLAKLSEYNQEIIFVDDGSDDHTFIKLKEISAENIFCRVIRLRTHFGKTAALMAAFPQVKGRYVITIDGDGQDDPREIPRIIEELNKGYDLVNCWKQYRQDLPMKRLLSRIFNTVTSFVFGVKLRDHNSGFKGYRREVIGELKLRGGMHRFIPVVAEKKGFTLVEIPVIHHQREYGCSKYGFERVWHGVFDLVCLLFLYRTSIKSLRFLCFFGIVFFVSGFFL